jgi:hypothetical protein
MPTKVKGFFTVLFRGHPTAFGSLVGAPIKKGLYQLFKDFTQAKQIAAKNIDGQPGSRKTLAVASGASQMPHGGQKGQKRPGYWLGAQDQACLGPRLKNETLFWMLRGIKPPDNQRDIAVILNI